MNKIAASELILNKDGSIYHLNLLPENIAKTIIFVGDPDRVEKVTKYFNSIDFETQKREFKTQTGTYKGKRITVISTGIGPDNIDIVLNELDALVNIDLKNRTVKKNHTSLDIIRIGTSGSLQNDIPVDNFLISSHAIGLDGMLHSYNCEHVCEKEIENEFMEFTGWSDKKASPYCIKCGAELAKKLSSEQTYSGITATAPGFYGPQGRVLRLTLQDENLNKKIDSFKFKNHRITNLEMETSAIYGLAKLLGHNAVSMNALIANRANGEFSSDPYKTVDRLIKYTLDKIVE